MGNLIKKYSNLIIAVVLIIATLTITTNLPLSVIRAGAGMEKNSEVDSLEEMYSVLNCIINRTISDRTEPEKTLKNSSYLFVADSEEKETNTPKHNSLTMVEDTVMYYQTGLSASIFTRKLTVYMTEEASYYISKGNMQSDDGYFNFDLHIYIGEDAVMAKFDKFKIVNTASENTVICEIKSYMTGNWIELPKDEIYYILNKIESMNANALEMLGEYIKNEIAFDEDSNVYKLERVNNSQTTDITVDLTDYENPYIKFVIDKEETVLENAAYISDTISFSNIDNTVVERNFGADYVCENDKDFAELFNGFFR